MKYLDFENIDWSKAPSSAGIFGDLVLAISEDNDINPFIFDITEDFDFKSVAEKIRNLATGINRLIRISEHNVDKVFNFFSKNIILEKNYPTNDLVALFFAIVTGDENTYLHPSKKNTLVYNGKNIRVNSSNFLAFINHFATSCSPKEKARLASISDRLIEDTNRRRKGEFYTPTAFVDYSHQMISKQFGEDWKDKYYVWDCAAGTLNLTRDYKFAHLYSSTLEQAELDIAKNYNPEAEKFQFDFLNDELKRISEGGKCPDSLIDALESNKPIIFYINPPYARPSGISCKDKKLNSIIQNIMRENKMEYASTVIYGEFLYRIIKIQEQFNLKNSNIALFCKPSFLQNSGFENFRKYFLNSFNFITGIYFNAGHFANVSSNWGITFNIWKCGKSTDINNFKHNIIDINNTGDIIVIGEKILYNIDGLISANKWVKIKTLPNSKLPLFKNSLNFKKDCLINVNSNALGFFLNHSNNVQQNGSFVQLFSVPSVQKVGTDILEDNFDKVCALYSARTLTQKSWINDKDEYLFPNIQNKNWNIYLNDAIIFSIFGLQVSLKNLICNNQQINITNHFFWCNPKDVAEWANDANIDEIYNEANSMPESFVYKKLQTITLSPEAQAVLDKANELLKASMKYRKLFNDDHPEYQILNADCGWYQIKAMLKEYMPNELNEFKKLYKALADKMRPMVYELGFLKK